MSASPSVDQQVIQVILIGPIIAKTQRLMVDVIGFFSALHATVLDSTLGAFAV